MALAEDAASVLEQFIQDVANLPAEIAHLLEEIQAKDRVIQECRNTIVARDGSIQKFLKANGAGQPNPKEETYAKNILANFDKAQIVQEEKVGLSDKAAHLLDRQIKRLDFKIRDLQNEGAIAIDPQLPSLLNTSTLTTRPPPLAGLHPGPSTALHPLSGNAGPSTTVALGNPLSRLAQPPHRHPSPSPLSNSALPPHITSSSTTSVPLASTAPATSSLLNPRPPPRSPSSDIPKRRRLNPHHLSIPPTSSTLRQSSLGPGTPKTLKPLSNSRGSSAGPRPASKKPPRANNPPHHQRIGHLNPSTGSITKKPSRRRPGKKDTLSAAAAAAGTLKPSPSDTGEESALSEVEGAEGESEDAEMDDGEGEGDDRKYCTCRSVSYGNMVACDNDECPYEWFHWSCVGMTKEPVGTWFCDECREKHR